MKQFNSKSVFYNIHSLKNISLEECLLVLRLQIVAMSPSVELVAITVTRPS